MKRLLPLLFVVSLAKADILPPSEASLSDIQAGTSHSKYVSPAGLAAGGNSNGVNLATVTATVQAWGSTGTVALANGLTNQPNTSSALPLITPKTGVWVLVDSVNGLDATATTNFIGSNSTQTAAFNYQTAVKMIITNGGVGTIFTVPGQSNSLDTIATPMTVSNNCSITVYNYGDQLVTTNAAFGSVWLFGTNTTFREFDPNYIIAFPSSAGANSIYGTVGGSSASGVVNFESYNGTGIGPEDTFFSFRLGYVPASSLFTNTFARLTMANRTFIGSWDAGLLNGANLVVSTNNLSQFINCTFTLTNNAITSGGTMHGIIFNGITIVANCVFNMTNVMSGGWAVNPISSGGAIAVINPIFNCQNTTGTSTNLVLNSRAKVLNFPELYNCAFGSNVWITGNLGTNAIMNIRTRDGQVYQEQVWP